MFIGKVICIALKILVLREKLQLKIKEPIFGQFICGNCGNADTQRVKSVYACGNCVAICGNERRSVAKVVAMWQFYYIFVSIRKDL